MRVPVFSFVMLLPCSPMWVVAYVDVVGIVGVVVVGSVGSVVVGSLAL